MDQHQPQRRLSEISHLFLSDVRARQTNNAARPQRKPPGSFKGDVSIDLTPEEFAQVFAESAPEPATRSEPARGKPVQAVIAHHLGEHMADRVRDFAGMLCQDGARVGLIYADASQVRVACVEHDPQAEPAAEDELTESLDAQRLTEVITELGQDIDQWLIVLPDHRSAESRDLLKRIGRWTLITGVDHDSVVNSYRAIKGLCEIAMPSLAVAVFGAVDESELDKTHRKLSSVCEQFLKMKAALLGAIEPGDEIAEHVVLSAAASDSAPQWRILGELVAGAPEAAPHHATPDARPKPTSSQASVPLVAPQASNPAMRSVPTESSRHEPAAIPVHDEGFANIIDLPQADMSPAAVAQAVIRGGHELIETPIKSPHHPDAVIAVSRDHDLVLLSLARAGLSDLRAIGLTYRWMNENRSLIAMALPQFAIDAHRMPRLELLVDHADISADILQPLLAASHVRVKAYRKLKWSGKTGLLLEAA